MKRVGSNERSHAIDLISNINFILNKYDLAIKRAGGEKTIFNDDIEADRRVMFPDVLLYGDKGQNEIIQGWEIKLTDTNINDERFIYDAQNKADILGLNSTVLWNFNSIRLYIKDINNHWELYKEWDDLNFISSREDVERNRENWIEFLDSFLKELNQFFLDGSIRPRELSAVTDNVVLHIINYNKGLVAEYLKEKNKENRLISSKINLWWENTRNEFLRDETNPYEAYSKVILLGWMLRFTFVHVIKDTHNSARIFDGITNEYSPEKLNKMFLEVTQKSDFYTIFESKDFDEYLPNTTWHQILQYNEFLEDKAINHEMLQDLLEITVARSKREIVGQFTTPTKLAKLLVQLTVRNGKGSTIDPCAGTGTIPKEVLNLKRTLGLSMNDAHDTTWGSDKLQVALQIANMSMTTNDSMNIINRIFQQNALRIATGEQIEFRSPMDGKLIKEIIPAFSNIVSNLPFIQSSSIDNKEKKYITEIKNEIRTKFNINIDDRADYYVYIFFNISKLLDENGRIGLITSNSWLGTKWGKQFYKLILELFNIESIVVSGKGRWFQNADIVTTLLILTKKKDNKNSTNFIEINKELENLSDEDIDIIADSIAIDAKSDFHSVVKLNTDEIEWFIDNGISLRSLVYDISWMNNVKMSLKPISDYFYMQRGERRGWNPLFHLPKEHGVESDYIRPMIKSSKQIKDLITTPKSEVLTVPLTLKELEELNHTGALSWIKKFENDVNKVEKPLTEELATAKQRWYELNPEGLLADFVTGMNPNRRIFWAMLEEPAFFNQRLIGILRNSRGKQFDKKILLALLNSILGIFFIEAAGFGRGLGALDLSKETVSQTLMLDPAELDDIQKHEIMSLFNEIDTTLNRDTLLTLEDQSRIRLDKYILKCYGLEDEYDNIKLSLSKLVNSRLSVR